MRISSEQVMAESQTNEVKQYKDYEDELLQRMREEETIRLSERIMRDLEYQRVEKTRSLSYLITRRLWKSDVETAAEVRQLLKDHANPNNQYQNDDRYTLLYVAVSRGLHDTVKVMLESSLVNINARAKNLITPLSKACIMEDQRMIEQLQAYGGSRYCLSGCHAPEDELKHEIRVERTVSRLYGARMKLRRDCPHECLLKDCGECGCRDAYYKAVRCINFYVKVNKIDDWNDGKDHEYERKRILYDDEDDDGHDDDDSIPED